MGVLIVVCFVVRYFMSILVLQSSWWGRLSLLPLVCLRFVIVVFPDHTHLLFLIYMRSHSHIADIIGKSRPSYQSCPNSTVLYPTGNSTDIIHEWVYPVAADQDGNITRYCSF